MQFTLLLEDGAMEILKVWTLEGDGILEAQLGTSYRASAAALPSAAILGLKFAIETWAKHTGI